MARKRRTKEELRIFRDDIRRRLRDGAEHSEIISSLQISDSTYFWHLQELYREDRESIGYVSENIIAFEIQQTLDRLRKTVATCEAIINDPESENSDKLAAAKTRDNTSVDIVRILRDIVGDNLNVKPLPKSTKTDNIQAEETKLFLESIG